MPPRKRKIRTRGKELSLPTLFPVRNLGKRWQDNTPNYAENIPDFNTAMVNSGSILKKPTISQEAQSSSIHSALDFDGVVFADSGGFDYGNKEDAPNPTELLAMQEEISADIIATLDLPVLNDMTRDEKNSRIKQNIKYALQASEQSREDYLLFASIHGKDSRTIVNTINHLERKGDFDGYAIGGLVPIRSNYNKVIDIILAARNATDKPIHVYGLGGFLYTLLLIYLGVDSFDSSAFIRCGGNRKYYLPSFGMDSISNFEKMERAPCTCPVCTENSLSEIRQERDLITQHNLWAHVSEIRKLKVAMSLDKDIEEFLDRRFQQNSTTQRAFETAKRKVRKY